ncbi:PQQ-dependent sugar dehydrogenase [Polymorphobacter fuscus]|uniref:Sorbosone dehydrogenase family protein n=1 Tax=Sandarakinorhabdus fusca TaxID=1439888 RepID=A0A7C9KY55_9SPHN|nr:sorbosone dehydrogenase family protein [Polymorphobacter fuscus]KAB7645444.1 sorbosone dehydrogenase family protein [Polymorphobacter fuscus]MQT17866.1 sorbosone dehydrogenase family protein [Polymorphobacter fuscus]NJC08495.1 glucose/arabinose dehydrogenase [Polymorphobacter fuscus]
MRRLTLFAPILLAACGDTATLPITAGQGTSPTLPAPASSLLPTVNIAKRVGWPDGAAPTAAPGLAVNAFAAGLAHPRWLYALPNGDILVAETNGPARPEEETGIKGKVQKLVMGLAGATVPSADRITLLRDTDGDGVADVQAPFLTGLHSPFGMVLVGDQLFVAEADRLTRFAYVPGATAITTPGTRVADLPGGPRNHHWTKNVVASADGKTLFVAVGSNSNVAENGLAAEKDRAAILAIDPATGGAAVFATGLRNPVGLAWNPVTGALWTSVNERDEIGSDLVPDYMTSVKPGAHYGWPWSWYGNHVDVRVKPERPDMVAKAIAPDYALGPHTASLGLAFAPATAALGPQFASGAFIGQHGSWNRKPASGYRVVFVPFADGKPQGLPVDVLTGFLNKDGQAQGRPVGVAFDAAGALLVADDAGNRVWRVTAANAAPAGSVAP